MESPLGPGAQIDVILSDPDDPGSPLEAALWPDNGSDHQELAWTMPNQRQSNFWWLLRSAASFHNIPVVLGDGVKEPGE